LSRTFLQINTVKCTVKCINNKNEKAFKCTFKCFYKLTKEQLSVTFK